MKILTLTSLEGIVHRGDHQDWPGAFSTLGRVYWQQLLWHWHVHQDGLHPPQNHRGCGCHQAAHCAVTPLELYHEADWPPLQLANDGGRHSQRGWLGRVERETVKSKSNCPGIRRPGLSTESLGHETTSDKSCYVYSYYWWYYLIFYFLMF